MAFITFKCCILQIIEGNIYLNIHVKLFNINAVNSSRAKRFVKENGIFFFSQYYGVPGYPVKAFLNEFDSSNYPVYKCFCFISLVQMSFMLYIKEEGEGGRVVGGGCDEISLHIVSSVFHSPYYQIRPPY